MTESRKDALAVLAAIADFLHRLPDDQIADLASGAALLTLIPAGAAGPLVPPRPRGNRSRTSKPVQDMSAVAEQLRSVETRDSARQLLSPLQKNPLLDLATQIGLSGLASATKPKLIDAIVEATVGNRLDSLAIRGTNDFPA
jgi:hypothetical protein